MATKINRSFVGISDLDMLGEAQTMSDLYFEDVDTFTDFDASLDATYGEQVQADIDAARQVPGDDAINAGIEELTQEVLKKWEACRRHFQQAKYFIIKAFEADLAIQQSFGFADYNQLVRTQNIVIQFMDQFHYRCVKHSAALIAAGYTQLKIDAIPVLTEAFRTANLQQEIAKKDRFIITENRIVTLNKVWKDIKAISSASKSIYKNNFAKLQQFMMPAGGTNQPADELALTGTIINTATNLPEAGVIITLPTLGVSTSTDKNGRFGFVQGLPPGTMAVEAAKAGCTTLHNMVTIKTSFTTTLNLQITPG